MADLIARILVRMFGRRRGSRDFVARQHLLVAALVALAAVPAGLVLVRQS